MQQLILSTTILITSAAVTPSMNGVGREGVRGGGGKGEEGEGRGKGGRSSRLE